MSTGAPLTEAAGVGRWTLCVPVSTFVDCFDTRRSSMTASPIDWKRSAGSFSSAREMTFINL